jgi:hypothetical protein
MSAAAFADLWNKYLDQPHEVSIETLARCNAACTFCPYPTLERIGTKMPDHLISRLIGEMSRWTVPFYFSPFKVNEPFLDVRLQSICEKFEADCPKGTLRLFTNGSALIDRHLDWVGNLRRVIHLWISLNDHRIDEYQALMGISFDRTAKNLDALHKRVEAGQFSHPVVLSKVGEPSGDFIAYCQDRWPSFSIQIIKKDSWLGFTEPDNGRVPPAPCVRWFELSITAEGLCSHCCMHNGANPTYNIGDLNKQTMLEVYNSPFWRERREKLVSRRTLDDRSPCRTCSY